MLGEQRISVYLIDDQSMIRGALRCLLVQIGPINVVGDAGSAREAILDIERQQPQVVLLDITMPGLSGLDAIPLIKKVSPDSQVLILSHHEGSSIIERALSQGAAGYISKESEPSELVLAITSVQSGNSYLSPRVAKNFLHRREDRDAVEAGGTIKALTPRERQVFQLLAIGRSNKAVASELGISLGTAKKHRENLKRKLQCPSTTDLVRLAIREGLLQV